MGKEKLLVTQLTYKPFVIMTCRTKYSPYLTSSKKKYDFCSSLRFNTFIWLAKTGINLSFTIFL